MAGPSRKEGLRCECGKLLIEKDPEMGLGVRCGRRECDKFHPLAEINQRAAEFENQKEIRRGKMEMKAYSLHSKNPEKSKSKFGICCVVLARSAKEATSILGGEYIEPEGGRKICSTNPDELHFAGTVRFSPELFRPMDETDRALAGLYGGSGVYNRGPLHLLTHGKAVELLLYEWEVVLPEYCSYLGE